MILNVICLLLLHHHSTASVIRMFQYSTTAPHAAIAIVYQQVEADRRISCIIKCAGDPNCSSASFEVPNICRLIGYSTDPALPNCIGCFQVNRERAWHTVYRANAGCGENVLNTFLSDDVINEDTPAMQSTSADVNGVYKSSAITTGRWQDITDVRLSIYTDDVEVMYMTFDTSGTDKENWFTQARITDSSYTDIRSFSSIDYFSVQGHADPLYSLTRRFYIMSRHCGCDCDPGWFVVLDVDSLVGACTWEIGQPRPTLMYSPDTGNVYANSFAEGDVFVLRAYTI